MTDDMPSAPQLRAEIDAMPSTRLQEVARTGDWPLHPSRVRLDTAERLAAARRAVADLARNHGRELWREPDARGGGVPISAIVARRLDALARAWERLGGGREFLFHVRGELRPAEDRPIARTHLDAPRIAIDPNPGVPRAPYLEHPISLAEAARFAVLQPVMRCCAALGAAASRAFDVLGQPTTALHRQALQHSEPPPRRQVWRLRSTARSARAQVRMEILTVRHVLGDIGDAAAPERFGVPAVACHPERWSRLATATIGALAWRLACERDARVGPSSPWAGHRMLASPAVVGRRYRELDDPFAPLLAVLRLGCRLHAFSCEATTLELHPLPIA